MKHNASWEVRTLTFSPVVTPRSSAKVTTAFDHLPLIITGGPLENKEHLLQRRQDENEHDMLYSSFQESSSSFGDSFSNSFSSLHSRKSSSRDSSGKSTRSSKDKKRTRRRGRRRSSVGGSSVAFDPARAPRKSCLKQTATSSPQSPSSSPKRRPRPKLGESFLICLPGSPEVLTKRTSTIRFSEGVHVREVRSSFDLCKGEIRPLWWQEDEYSAIKENLQRLVRQVNRKGENKTNGRKYCTRGLERFVDPTYNKDANRVAAERAVLYEQNRQREIGTFDELRIAAFYFGKTRASSKRAVNRGADDAIMALRIFNDGKDRSKRRSFLGTDSQNETNTTIRLSPSLSNIKKASRRSSLGSMMPRRGSLTFRRKPEEPRLKKSESYRQMRPSVSA